MSLDPKVAKTLQPYQYVGNDPLNGTDPTGLCASGKVTDNNGTCVAKANLKSDNAKIAAYAAAENALIAKIQAEAAAETKSSAASGSGAAAPYDVGGPAPAVTPTTVQGAAIAGAQTPSASAPNLLKAVKKVACFGFSFLPFVPDASAGGALKGAGAGAMGVGSTVVGTSAANEADSEGLSNFGIGLGVFIDGIGVTLYTAGSVESYASC